MRSSIYIIYRFASTRPRGPPPIEAPSNYRDADKSYYVAEAGGRLRQETSRDSPRALLCLGIAVGDDPVIVTMTRRWPFPAVLLDPLYEALRQRGITARRLQYRAFDVPWLGARRSHGHPAARWIPYRSGAKGCTTMQM